jgi:hypothetical protein
VAGLEQSGSHFQPHVPETDKRDFCHSLFSKCWIYIRLRPSRALGTWLKELVAKEGWGFW